MTLVPRRPLALLEGTWALVHWFQSSSAVLYADVTTPPTLLRRPDGWTLEYCDLDLDVIRDRGKPAWIDDELEFVEHAVSMGYPAWVHERARATADALLASAHLRTAPGEHARHAWLARLDELLEHA